MRPICRTLLAGATAAGLMGGTALAQQIILVPEGQGPQSGDQRYLLVPAPRFAPEPDALDRGPDSAMAMELYRRGYQRGIEDAERAGASRQQIDPAAIERIGRELFERGYLLGMMQAQLQAAQGQAGQEQAAQQQMGQKTGQQTEQQQTAQQQTGQKQTGQSQSSQAQTGQAKSGQTQAGQAQAAQQGDQAQGMSPQPDATITTEVGPQYGPYLVDVHGQALYMFTADTQAQGASEEAVSACYDACAEAWPPVLTSGAPVEAAGTVQSDLLGTTERQDGATQVTYDGWPLYYYVEDQAVGEAKGQDVHGFGGEWYLLTPEGEKVGEG